jgi:hypothetical protein
MRDFDRYAVLLAMHVKMCDDEGVMMKECIGNK